MNSKVLVELTVPVLEVTYDVYIPVNKKVGEVIQLVSKIVAEMSGGYFIAYNKNLLYSGDSGDRYPVDVLIAKTDIRNGSKIILM